MNVFIQIFLPALDFFYEVTKNYGLAIILLTIVVKAAFWQMTAKQYTSMAAMKKIQPKLKVLQEKHKKDPQKLQKEMMVLYKEHGVNPFSGCLPLIIQLPILIGLYSALSCKEFLMKTAGKSFLWIKDISFSEVFNFSDQVHWPKSFPDYQIQHITAAHLEGFNSLLPFSSVSILAILVALLTYWSQKSMDLPKEQQSMLMIMPVMMFFLCQSMNAGVGIYIAVSTLLTWAQQVYIQKGTTVADDVTIVEVERIEDKPKEKK